MKGNLRELGIFLDCWVDTMDLEDVYRDDTTYEVYYRCTKILKILEETNSYSRIEEDE